MIYEKCKGEGCLIQESCQRFTEPAEPDQRYLAALWSPSKGCPWYLPVKVEPTINLPKTTCKICGDMHDYADLINHFGVLMCKKCLRIQGKDIYLGRV